MSEKLSSRVCVNCIYEGVCVCVCVSVCECVCEREREREMIGLPYYCQDAVRSL